MEHSQFSVQRRGHGKKDSSSEESSASQLKKLTKRATSHWALDVNIIQSQNSNVFPKHLFFLLVHGHYKIPKLMASVDEMYIRRCLELVHISALKASQHNKPVSSETKNLWTSAESLNTVELIGGVERGSDQLVLARPLAAMTESVVQSANAAENWTLGTVIGTKSVINILNSPILQEFGASERNDNLNSMNFSEAKNMTCHDLFDSPCGFSISSSHKLEMETPMVQSHKYGSISVHKRTTSKTNSTCFDWLSSACNVSQGMLQCTWKQGVPNFVFSADDQNEVYVAKLSKLDSTHDEALDYVYLFHLNKGGGHEIPDPDLQLVGKMNVSTCFTLCPHNRRLMETRFILFGNGKFHDKEIHTLNHSHKKNKGMAKKASQLLRTSPSSKHRTLSKFSRSKVTRESCPLDKQSFDLAGINLLETNVPINFELAAIVVKDHLPSHNLDKIGGWGLKFLNKRGVNQATLPSECCNRNPRDFSTSLSILIPAGFHGGPRTKHGGPSSLIDRWKSGGLCDCGGWDEGCPLTVLERRSSNEGIQSHADMQGECKSINLATQGSSNFRTTLRMVNIHDGLYIIHFQQPLSALQSFSIAVAIIHMQRKKVEVI